MRSPRSTRCIALVAVLLAATACAQAAALRSTSRNQRNAVMEYSGFFLNPVGTVPEGPGDLAPSQLFEIVRPGNQAIQLGRLYTSCVCVALEAEKDYFAEGEHAVVRLRNVKATPSTGTMYAVYVQLKSPVSTVLRFDTFMRSSQFIPAPEGAPPTRGNIIADGVLEPAVEAAVEAAEAAPAEDKSGKIFAPDGVELIIPKADIPAPAAEKSNDNGPIVSEVVEITE